MLKISKNDQTACINASWQRANKSLKVLNHRNEPILIVEVISPSTAQTDRREKLRAYQQMPSVHEYVIVEQDLISVEIHRRQTDGRWITYFFTRQDTELTLESVDLTIQLEEVYRRVNFE